MERPPSRCGRSFRTKMNEPRASVGFFGLSGHSPEPDLAPVEAESGKRAVIQHGACDSGRWGLQMMKFVFGSTGGLAVRRGLR